MKITVSKWIWASALSIVFCSSSMAEPRWVVGLGGGLHHNEVNSDSVNPLNIYLSLALAINNHVEVGVEISTTLADDDIGSSDFDVDTTFVFVRGLLPLDNGTVLYAQIGNSSIELAERNSSSTTNADDADSGYGIGARFGLGNESAYSIEYISYFDDDEFDNVVGNASHSSLNLGYLSYF